MADLTTAWGEYAEPDEETARLRKTFLAALHEHARAELDAMGDALLPTVRRAWEVSHLQGVAPYAGLWGDILTGAERHRLSPAEEALRAELRDACRLNIPPGLFAPWFARWAVAELEEWVADRQAAQERVWTWGLRDGPLPRGETEVRVDLHATLRVGAWDPFTCTRAEAEKALRAELDRLLRAERDRLLHAELDRIEAAAAEMGDRVKTRTRESETHAVWTVWVQVRRMSPSEVAEAVSYDLDTVKQAVARLRGLLDLPRLRPPGRPKKGE